LLHVHRDIYTGYWHTFIRECEFHVRIRSSEPTTSFSDFKPLQNLLRKHLNTCSLFSVEVMPPSFTTAVCTCSHPHGDLAVYRSR
jgi:hypothetical protein